MEEKIRKGTEVFLFYSKPEVKEQSQIIESVTSMTYEITDEASKVPSSDSENIARLLDGFEYDPSKKEKILVKYNNLLKK